MNEIISELELPHKPPIQDQTIITQDNQAKAIKKGKRLYQWKQRTIARDQQNTG
jgi:hypothetical protein